MTDFLKVKNRASSSLASGITDVATSLTVSAGEGVKFPATPFHITILDEILKVTSISTDTFTVVRAQEGTTGVAHSSGEAVRLQITAKSITDLNAAVNTLETQGGGSMVLASNVASESVGPGISTNFWAIGVRNVTEANSGSPVSKAFTIKEFAVFVNFNSLTSPTTTFQIFKNGSAVGTAISYLFAVTGVKTQSQNISVAVGDRLTMRVQVGAGGGSGSITWYSSTIGFTDS